MTLLDTDPLAPVNHLAAGETLLWSGRPEAKAPLSGALKLARIAGYIGLGCFLIFGAFAWTNRDDLEGAGGFLTIFLALSLTQGVGLIWGLPILVRRGKAKTRYGITDSRAMIVHGMQGVRVKMFRVQKDAEIKQRLVGSSLSNVIFGSITHDLYTPNLPTPGLGQRTRIGQLLQFESLPIADAKDALNALNQIKGAGGEGPIIEIRKT